MIELGIIACGDVAFRTYIPAIQSLSGRATVSATFDPVQERAERAAAMFEGAQAYTDLDSFLAHPGLGGVFNLTPSNLHTTVNTAVLDAGLNLFSEKPIASTVAQGQQLAARARKAEKLLMVAPAVMATDRFRWLRHLIDQGVFGQMTVATGQMVNMGPAGWTEYTGDPGVFYSSDVGPVIDTGVYVLHAITGLFGAAKRVQAFSGIALPERTVTIPRLAGQRVTVEAPDINLIQLDFGDNRFAQVLSSFAVPASKGPAVEIHGSLGSASIGAAGWYESNGPADLFFLGESAFGASGWHESIRNPDPLGGPDDHLIGSGPRHFVDVLEGQSRSVLTPEHAIHVLEIIRSARESSVEGRAINLTTTF